MLEVGEDYLALEWIEPGGLERGGRGGARTRRSPLTHAAGAPCFGDPGLGERLGVEARVRLAAPPNEPRRGLALLLRRAAPAAARADRARARRAAPRRRWRRSSACASGSASSPGPPEPPARLHGDLWSGNVLADARGRPWLIDPSAYGGHREVDLAMLRLFGAPSERIFEAYEEVPPLAEGWEERVEL